MTRLRPGFSTSPSPCSTLLVATALVLAPAILPAQTHKVAAPEHVTRAIAVYEWTGDLDKPKAARLVPVSLFINSHFEDAGVYLARPVPFSLQTGDLYELERAGHDEGTFSLDHARHVLPFADPNGESTGAWFAYGKFAPPKPVPKAPVLQASAHKPEIVSSADSDRPSFTKRSTDSSASSSKSSTNSDKTSATDSSDNTKTTSSTDSSSGSGKSSSKDDDVDRPTLRKRDPSTDAQRQQTIKSGQSGVTGPEVSLNDDPDRPHMRHGAPPGSADTPELTGLPADMHQVAAVSDAATRDAHIFAREWESPTERADTLAKLQALALPQVAAYVAANRLIPGAPLILTSPATALPATPTSSAPTTSSATTPSAEPTPSDDASAPALKRGVPKDYQNQAAGKPPASVTTPAASVPAATSSTPATKPNSPTPKPTTTRTATARYGAKRPVKSAPASPLVLTDVQLTPYTLTYGGLPTFVYSAQASVKTGGPVYVTLVAQRMVSGEFQVALNSVTDATHLDRAPWMRLVDAVDPDAGHRASLLFEMRAQTTRQFALYRLTTAHAEQTFSTGVM